MLDRVKQFWNDYPLLSLVLIALVPRLIAAFFSRGFGMHDDHFGPIEQPFIIMQYPTYWTGRVAPHGHSIVYPLIHYGLLNFFQLCGVYDPQTKMLFIRFLHAFYSLLIVIFGYKIAETLSDERTARKAGLVLALFWVLPFLGVRNLIEVICVPPLMAGFYYALTSKERMRDAFTAGLWFGLAFVFRYQTLLVTGTVGLIFLFRKEYKLMLLCAVGFMLSVLVVQGSVDIFAWGYPFASFIEYVRYNAAHGEDYTTGPWYNYLLLIIGVMLPPMSFMFLYGIARNWRKTLLVLLPVLVFFVLHSYFPNKQERFILPVFPAILVLGIVGWEETVRKSTFWLRHRTAVKGLWVSFWAINLILLLPFSTFYGKRSMVEAMYELYGKPLTGLVLVGGKVGTSQPPLFYTGTYPVTYYEINDDEKLKEVKAELAISPLQISHVVFFGAEDLDRRLRHIETELNLDLALERQTQPSLLDVLFYKLNPTHNKNEVTFVYSVKSRR